MRRGKLCLALRRYLDALKHLGSKNVDAAVCQIADEGLRLLCKVQDSAVIIGNHATIVAGLGSTDLLVVRSLEERVSNLLAKKGYDGLVLIMERKHLWQRESTQNLQPSSACRTRTLAYAYVTVEHDKM